jgi:UPF0755 protein
MCAKKPGKTLKRVLSLITLGVLLFAAYSLYVAFFKPNIYLDGKKYKFIYIPTKFTYQEMIGMLEEENILQDKKTFEWLAKAYDLQNTFKPGKYRIIAGMTNRQLINSIKNGKQEKVKITFNSFDHTNDDIVNKIADKLEITEEELETFFVAETPLRDKYNFTDENLRCLFLPETYELNWNTSLPDFMQLVEKNYTDFWTSTRMQKAKRANLTQTEVIVLASIVQSESAIDEEQQQIAGVYINRMHKNMPLQADPTLIYAVGDFSIKRVRSRDKDIDSPYNTYKNKGLPPGPICLPYQQAIDAVLNYNRHNFLYFCAKPNLNGYSNYSVTYEDHKKYADAYQKEMDRRGINR